MPKPLLPRPSPGLTASGAALLFIVCLVCAFAFKAPDLRRDIPFSTIVLDRNGAVLRMTTAEDGRYRLWYDLGQYPANLEKAVLAKEDRSFWILPAFNPFSLVRATWHSLVTRDYRAGASTITMQVARLVWKLDTDNFGGKLVQILASVALSLRYTKTDILALYFNLAPCGGNVEGFGTASRIYFGKEPGNLNLAESLTLAVLPQDPGLRNPLQDSSSAAIRTARDRLYSGLSSGSSDYSAEKSEFEFPTEFRRALPFEAPHATTRLLAENPLSHRIVSTLDLKVQRVLERRIQQFTERKSSTGIENAAALLVKADTMEILASVGSSDFSNDAINGQVDGTLAPRSPGSALKPFIYALAMQEGLIHPYSILNDAPSHFGAYNPDNFDNDFLGPIRAIDALILSRNVPAVALAQKLDKPDLYDFLTDAGVALPFDRRHYGLSLALGAADISMVDLVGLYGAIANGGTTRSPSLVKSTETFRRILSPESAWLVRRMLEAKPRPENDTGEPAYISGDENPSAVAYKTGTSIGFRDAWSIGIFDGYILAVWIGNFSGQGNNSFVGLSAAAPLMFDIVDALRAGSSLKASVPPPQPPGIVKVAVCAVSGEIAGPYCDTVVMAPFIAGVSPIEVCTVHNPFEIDVDTGLRRSHAIPGRTRQEVFEIWPADVMRVFAEAGLRRKVPPPLDPRDGASESLGNGTAPRISSPVPGMTYIVNPQSSDSRIPLLSTMGSDARTVWWFIDGNLAGTVGGNEAFYWVPIPGRHRIKVVDDKGRSADSSFEVQSGS